MPRILITGVNGFVGSHLAEAYLGYNPGFVDQDQEMEVFGLVRRRSSMEFISHLSSIKLYECDLTDPHSVNEAIRTIQPQVVHHLAAQSFVPESWTAPAKTIEANLLGTLHLLEAIRHHAPDAAVQLASSSEIYGPQAVMPITEAAVPEPVSPYGVSKLAMDRLGMQYHKSYGLRVVVTRAFNHSVLPSTPIIVRNAQGVIDVLPIGDLRKAQARKYDQVWDLSNSGLEVWGNGKFTKIIHVSAHRNQLGAVKMVQARGGVVAVTGRHAVFNDKSRWVDAQKLQPKQGMYLTQLPASSQIGHTSADWAWFLGFLVANGDIQPNKGVRFVSPHITFLERADAIAFSHVLKRGWIYKQLGCWRLCIASNQLANWLYPEVYTHHGLKRIPRVILNAAPDIQWHFLDGYNAGDGLKAGYGNYHFKNFTTNSPTLALGLVCLIESVLHQRYIICCEHRDERCYYHINLNSPNNPHKSGAHLKRPKEEITSIKDVPYNGFVYDLETEDHVFHAGVGQIIVHNTGPRRGDVFVTSTFAKQIAAIELGAEPIIRVGNLEAERDWTDVRDIVLAYIHAIGTPACIGTALNISSGQCYSIQWVLDALVRRSSKDVTVQPDPSRMRPSDLPKLLGDSSAFRALTGWSPTIPFEHTLDDLLQYWRLRLRGQCWVPTEVIADGHAGQ